LVLGEDFTPGALRLTATDELDDPAAIARAEHVPSRPVRFEPDEGDLALDWLGTTWAALHIVSERFIDCLRARGFTGWATYPVEITAGKRLEGYHGLAITGRCGPIDDRLSPPVALPPPVSQGRASTGRRGLLFEYGTWDTSDVFCGPMGTRLFATIEVVDALRQDGITNVSSRRVLDVERTWNADGSLLR
jgi:hypothetical protein